MESIDFSTDEGARILKAAALSGPFFAKVFFPKTVRNNFGAFHSRMWEPLDNPHRRFVNEIASRGFSKTTTLRLFCAKRIGFNLSRTILFIGASEAHSSRSIQWIRNAVERNALFASTFQLRKGAKWTDIEIEIIHGVQERPIWIYGAGITGNIRGINFDDYRPDLIIGDDFLTDENCATLEQRHKINDLMLGSVMQSLAPKVDEPNAKLVCLNTPHHREDFSQAAKNHPLFHTVELPCWTPETSRLSLHQQISAWEEVYPTEELRKEKLAAIQSNTLSVFSREKECILITPEAAAFKPEWIKTYTHLPSGIFPIVVTVDPVPPPSEREMSKGLIGKDYEAIHVWGRKGADFFLLDRASSRGHDPNWTVTTALGLAQKHGALRIVVEGVGYQKVLKNLLETEMARRKLYFMISVKMQGKLSKFSRIVNTLSGPASLGHIHVPISDVVFTQQFQEYGPTYQGHDDELDAASMAIQDIQSPFAEAAADADFEMPYDKYDRELENFRSAP